MPIPHRERHQLCQISLIWQVTGLAVLPLALLLQLIFSCGHQLGVVRWRGGHILELTNLIRHRSLATCCIVVDENCTALLYQRPQRKLKTRLQVFFKLHMLCIANSTSRMFTIKNNSCDELTRTACFKRATCRFALRALTIASLFLLGFRAVNKSRPITSMTSSAAMVCTVFFHPFENTSPFFAGLCSRHQT